MSSDSPEADFVTVARSNDLSAGQVRHIDMPDGGAVCLARVEAEYFAIDGACPHAGAFLGEGVLEGTQVICPWHGLPFDVRTGKATGALAAEAGDVCTFEVRVQGEEIQVRKRQG